MELRRKNSLVMDVEGNPINGNKNKGNDEDIMNTFDVNISYADSKRWWDIG